METSNSADNPPTVDTSDLIAFLGGRDRCSTPEVAKYISEQWIIPGSPISRWYDEHVRKCAANAEDINWERLSGEGEK